MIVDEVVEIPVFLDETYSKRVINAQVEEQVYRNVSVERERSDSSLVVSSLQL